MLIKAGGAARRSRQILRSEEVDHQAALLGVVMMKTRRMMRGMRGVVAVVMKMMVKMRMMEIKIRV